MKLLRKVLWRQLIPVLLTALMVVIFKTVFLIGYVPTESMEPTLKKGSCIIGVRIFSELKVGDIIVFRHEGRMLVKRIAAVGGEYVKRGEAELAVPEGCYYVLGDNAEVSWDSRYWEEPFVWEADVVAQITLNI